MQNKSNRICPGENRKTRYLLILFPLFLFHFLGQQFEASLLAQFPYFTGKRSCFQSGY